MDPIVPKYLMHFNPGLPHQVRHSEAWAQSGIPVTSDRSAPADIHIISGPHYALREWNDRPIVMMDRAFWGDPEYVQVFWRMPDGTRRYTEGAGERPKPKCLPWQEREDNCIVLADYRQNIDDICAEAIKRFPCVKKRYHPAEKKGTGSLLGGLMLAHVAVGTKSTALVEAAIMGRPVICLDKRNPVAPVAVSSFADDLYRGARDAWLHGLSWTQFTMEEIAAGFVLEKLNEIQGISV